MTYVTFGSLLLLVYDQTGALDARIGISVTLLAVGLIMVGVGIALYIVDVRGDSSLDRRRSREYYSPLDE